MMQTVPERVWCTARPPVPTHHHGCRASPDEQEALEVLSDSGERCRRQLIAYKPFMNDANPLARPHVTGHASTPATLLSSTIPCLRGCMRYETLVCTFAAADGDEGNANRMERPEGMTKRG
jgi:hypothetical protein